MTKKVNGIAYTYTCKSMSLGFGLKCEIQILIEEHQAGKKTCMYEAKGGRVYSSSNFQKVLQLMYI